jgi:NADH-quinone oxidoreductase subunit G
LPFDSLHALRQRLFADYPLFAKIDAIHPGDPADIAKIADGGMVAGDAPFAPAVEDFYLSNPIARASAVMAECSALARGELKQAAE